MAGDFPYTPAPHPFGGGVVAARGFGPLRMGSSPIPQPPFEEDTR